MGERRDGAQTSYAASVRRAVVASASMRVPTRPDIQRAGGNNRDAGSAMERADRAALADRRALQRFRAATLGAWTVGFCSAAASSPCKVSSDSIKCSSALEHTPSSSTSSQPGAAMYA